MSTVVDTERKSTGTSPFMAMPGMIMKALQDSSAGTHKNIADLYLASLKQIGLPLLPGNGGSPEGIFQSPGALLKGSAVSLNALQEKTEAFLKVAKTQQAGILEVYKSWAACLKKVSDAYLTDGPEKALKTYVESSEALVDSIESVAGDQASVFFDYWRSLLPQENQTAKAKKEKAA